MAKLELILVLATAALLVKGQLRNQQTDFIFPNSAENIGRTPNVNQANAANAQPLHPQTGAAPNAPNGIFGPSFAPNGNVAPPNFAPNGGPNFAPNGGPNFAPNGGPNFAPNGGPNFAPSGNGALNLAPGFQPNAGQNFVQGAIAPPNSPDAPRRVIATVAANPAPGADHLEYVREFSWNLFKNSKLQSSIGNLVLCPLQIHLLLSLIRTAAAELTEEEIRSTLQESNPKLINDLVAAMRQVTASGNSILDIENAVFLANDLRLNSSFHQESLARSVNIVPVNFDSVEESSYVINNWIARATRNRIQSLYKPDAIRGARLLFATTIYFAKQWKYAFNETAPGRFETTDQLFKTVPMMKGILTIRSGDMTLRNGFTGRWVELPYAGNDFSMILIAPFQRHYLDEFIRSMDASDFTSIFKQLDGSYKKKVHLEIPKFSVGSTFSLVNTLLKMGIVNLFTQNCKLPYLAEGQQSVLRVDDILQQSVLSVDESGTVASSATISHVVTLSLSSAPDEIAFKVDQPFISVIVDKRNKVPIFVSKIYDP